MLTSEKATVQLHKSGFILPDALGDPFYEAGHKRVLLNARSGDTALKIHVALRKIQGAYRLYFGKSHQKTLGIFPSDDFEVQIMEDTSKYGVDVPEALQAVMDSDPEGSQLFESLSDGKKRSIIYMIRRIRREQTQVDKSLLIFENLKRGFREHKDLIGHI